MRPVSALIWAVAALAAADFGRADRRLAHPGWFLGGAEMVWIAGPG